MKINDSQFSEIEITLYCTNLYIVKTAIVPVFEHQIIKNSFNKAKYIRKINKNLFCKVKGVSKILYFMKINFFYNLYIILLDKTHEKYI